MAVSVTVAVVIAVNNCLTVENLKQLSCVKEKVDRLSKSVNKHVTGPAVG